MNKPRWDEIPTEYCWLAQNKNGYWYAHKNEPEIIDGIWRVRDKLEWGIFTSYGNPNPTWQGTLEQRPEGVAGVAVKQSWTLRKEKEIAVAHSLDLEYVSPCTRKHGHNLQIAVEVTVDILNKSDMVIDAQDIGKVIAELDHQDLDELYLFQGLTTMEKIAQYIAREIWVKIPDDYMSWASNPFADGNPLVVRVEVKETAGNSVVYTRKSK